MSSQLRIKFRCESCNKSLSIGKRKCGQEVTCPNCKSRTTVPEETYELDRNGDESKDGQIAPSDLEESTEENPFEEFRVYDDLDQPTLVYEQSESVAQEINVNQRLSVHRNVVYFQGLLLGITAVSFFLMGLLIGSSGRPEKSTQSAKAIVSGIIEYVDGDSNFVDEGAVVFLLPTEYTLERELDSIELMPGRLFTNSNPEAQAIRSIGGDVTTANLSGYFQVEVDPGQEYLLLVVSANGTRKSEELDSEYYTLFSDYFSSVNELIEFRIAHFQRTYPESGNNDMGTIKLFP